ncbi:MAG: DUF1828 domain-containing protein [Candidatus Marsarchaeota archaeon]|nr:DUF1828 domain-containing protein [Candidatus Marsarchaeota archaeon]
MDYLELLRSQFNNRVRLTEKRPNVLQLEAPLYHEDGDMLDIFIEIPRNGGKIKVCDFGMTLMRLSYSFDIDTPNKERIFNRILSENQVTETNGNLCIETTPEGLYPAILQFAQVVGKVSNMQLYKREVVQSLFYEMMQEFIEDKLGAYIPTPNILPMPERDDLEVDWQLSLHDKSFYMFGVRDSAKARLVTISCLEFQKAGLPFTSMVVHEDFEGLPKKDRSRITSAVDKQFISLDDFKEKAVGYIERAAS